MTIQAEAPPLKMDEHGTIRVAGTRVTLETVVGEYLDGASAEAIAEAYDALSLADVYATIAYYLRHRIALDEYLRESERQGGELRRRIESTPENQALRKRILDRARDRGLRP
jgi:uncharacterized protein (DUF433 family)